MSMDAGFIGPWREGGCSIRSQKTAHDPADAGPSGQLGKSPRAPLCQRGAKRKKSAEFVKLLAILGLGRIRTPRIHLCKQAVQRGNLRDDLFVFGALKL